MPTWKEISRCVLDRTLFILPPIDERSGIANQKLSFLGVVGEGRMLLQFAMRLENAC